MVRVNAGFQLSGEAEAFLSVRRSRVVRFNGDWFAYESGGFYREISNEVIRAEIRRACAWPLTPTNINAALDEIQAATVIDGHGVTLPAWIREDGTAVSACGYIPCRNGILDPIAGQLYQHTDSLFVLNALPFDYMPNATAPVRWLQFLHEVFSGDGESIAELQKLTGYLLTQDTSQQKIFAIIGPKRSGKGTIGRVLESLIGPDNVCAPSFNGIGTDFGLQSFIGKQLAIIPDARTGKRTDKAVVAERLLNISGEDAINVPRKHRVDWHGKLNTRILILSNELPVFADAAGALSSRYVIWTTPNSFYGREDRGLTDTLRTELPSIMNWALDGLRRLAIEETIRTPSMARDLLNEIDILGSPIRAFVMEQCTINERLSVTKDELWGAYRLWHLQKGMPGSPLSKEMFGRNLKTAFPELKDYRPRLTDGRAWNWSGLALTYPDQGTSINYVIPNVPAGPGAV